jgi:hypothetical protein
MCFLPILFSFYELFYQGMKRGLQGGRSFTSLHMGKISFTTYFDHLLAFTLNSFSAFHDAQIPKMTPHHHSAAPGSSRPRLNSTQHASTINDPHILLQPTVYDI